MARGRLIPTDRGCVTVRALKNRLFIGNACFTVVNLSVKDVLPRVVFLRRVTLFARHYRNIGIFHRPHIAILCDPYMARSAVFFNVADASVVKFE